MLRTFGSVRNILQIKQIQWKQFSSSSGSGNLTATYNPLDKYLATNKHYLVFRKDSKLLHQFDAEAVYTKQWPYSQSCNDWEKSRDFDNNDELLDAFHSVINHSISSGISLSDERYDRFIDVFISRLENLNANELLASLQIFNKLPLSRTLVKERNYIELYTAFDQYTSLQCHQLTTDQAMFLLSIWIQIPHVDKSYFAKCALNLFSKRIRSMNIHRLLQYLYYNSCLFEHIPYMDAVEKHLAQNMDNMTVEEMAIVAWAFIQQDARLEQHKLVANCLQFFAKNDLTQLDRVYLHKVLPVSRWQLILIFISVWAVFEIFRIFSVHCKNWARITSDSSDDDFSKLPRYHLNATTQRMYAHC